MHIWGQPCDIEGLQQIARRHGLPLLFDAAHATGSSYRSVRLGGFGDAEVFSLHATKSINGLEGGMVATNDGDLAERVRLLRNFGFVGEDSVSGIGINAKMNEFSAAMALANLECYDRLYAHDRDIHAAYRHGLAGLDGIALQECQPDCERCDHYAVLSVSETAAIGREALRRVLAAENVVDPPLLLPGLPSLAAIQPVGDRSLPITDELCRTVLQLPTGLQLTPDDAAKIAAIIARACELPTRSRRFLRPGTPNDEVRGPCGCQGRGRAHRRLRLAPSKHRRRSDSRVRLRIHRRDTRHPRG